MPQQHPRLPEACAELIRRWHERYGVRHLPSNMREDQLVQYQERVEYFHHVDLSDPRAQQEIAHEQQGRVFERFYAATIPADLWREVTGDYELFAHRPPEHLGEAARWILEPPPSVDMPEQRDDKSRLAVEASTRSRLLEQAADFYADVVAEQRTGIGGLNVLLSCSLERYPWDGASQQRSTLLRPEVLGLRVAVGGERPDDFVDAIRQGDLVVESTIGGPTEPIHRPDHADESNGER